MPTCPFCAEEISAGAVKCKHCGEWLSQPLAETAKQRPRQEVQVVQGREDQSTILPYVLLALAVLYTLSPVDLVPDVPVVGWFDDVFALVAAGLNVLQHGLGRQNRLLEQIVGLLKWGIMVIGVMVILLIVLVGTAIIKLFSN